MLKSLSNITSEVVLKGNLGLNKKKRGSINFKAILYVEFILIINILIFQTCVESFVIHGFKFHSQLYLHSFYLCFN